MEKENKSLINKKFYVHTFGCQMNENDSEHIAGILTSEGALPSNSPENSHIIIVNTCAVREKSVKKLYSLLGRLSSMKKNNDIIIGVTGCAAQLYQSELLDEKPFIDFVMGPHNYKKIPEILRFLNGEKTVSTNWSPRWEEVPDSQICRKSRISSYVTIMEGCNNYCSYCVVPFTRGREKYRPVLNILREIEDLARTGYQEIQLLGQNVNSYRDSETGMGFSALLKEVDKIEGIEWVRFITSHPKSFTPELTETMKESKKICHQLHLPVQSGSTSVLQSMNRGYTREEYLEKIALLRSLMPDINFSTDIIVGFPGESEKDFLETLDILKTVCYTNIFSFCYSPRPHTSAAQANNDPIPFEEKKRRLKEVQKLQKNLQLQLNKSFIGRKIKVLCTGKNKKDPNSNIGRNEGYQVVNFSSKYDCIGKFVYVQVTGYGPYSLQGKAISTVERPK